MRIFGDASPGSKTFPKGPRSLPAEATLARISPLRSSFGVTRVANLTGLDRTGIPVVMVCRPNARSTAVFNGKGINLAAAKASGLMEAIETWHAEHIQLPIRFASFAELGREVKTAEVDLLPRIPESRFHADPPMLWVEGRDLIDRQSVWVPFEIVHADSTVDGPPLSGCFSRSTNGLASGNHFPEAVSHALCEIIERDATRLASKPARRTGPRRLDLATVDDATSLPFSISWRGPNSTSASGTSRPMSASSRSSASSSTAPAISAISASAPPAILRGDRVFGARSEAAQVRTTYIIGSREDIRAGRLGSATLAETMRGPSADAARPIRTRSFKSAANSELRERRGGGRLASRQASIRSG